MWQTRLPYSIGTAAAKISVDMSAAAAACAVVATAATAAGASGGAASAAAGAGGGGAGSAAAAGREGGGSEQGVNTAVGAVPAVPAPVSGSSGSGSGGDTVTPLARDGRRDRDQTQDRGLDGASDAPAPPSPAADGGGGSGGGNRVGGRSGKVVDDEGGAAAAATTAAAEPPSSSAEEGVDSTSGVKTAGSEDGEEGSEGHVAKGWGGEEGEGKGEDAGEEKEEGKKDEGGHRAEEGAGPARKKSWLDVGGVLGTDELYLRTSGFLDGTVARGRLGVGREEAHFWRGKGREGFTNGTRWGGGGCWRWLQQLPAVMMVPALV